jgi:hypothetical protein
VRLDFGPALLVALHATTRWALTNERDFRAIAANGNKVPRWEVQRLTNSLESATARPAADICGRKRLPCCPHRPPRQRA